MEPEVITQFKGPGQWRSQAAELEKEDTEEVDTGDDTE